MASVITPVGRVSFPKVFTAEQVNGQGDPKYSLTLIFDPADPGLDMMRNAAAEAATKKWGNKIPTPLKTPFLDGDEMGRPETAGKVVVRFSSKESNGAPGVLDKSKNKIDQTEFYSGCYARVAANSYGWTYMGKSGVSFGLNHVQKTDEGEALDGRGTADQAFDVVEGAPPATDAASIF